MDEESQADAGHYQSPPSSPTQESKRINATADSPATKQELAEVEKQASGFERATLRWARAAVIVAGLAALFACLQFVIMKCTLDEMKQSGETSTNQLWQAIGNMNWMARTADGSLHQTQSTLEITQQQLGTLQQQTRMQRQVSSQTVGATIVPDIVLFRLHKCTTTDGGCISEIEGSTHIRNLGQMYPEFVEYITKISDNLPAPKQRALNKSEIATGDPAKFPPVFTNVDYGVYSPSGNLIPIKNSGHRIIYAWGEVRFRNLGLPSPPVKFCRYIDVAKFDNAQGRDCKQNDRYCDKDNALHRKLIDIRDPDLEFCPDDPKQPNNPN